MSNFAPFGKHVHEQFAQMSAATEIFRVDIDADWLWQMYLDA